MKKYNSLRCIKNKQYLIIIVFEFVWKLGNGGLDDSVINLLIQIHSLVVYGEKGVMLFTAPKMLKMMFKESFSFKTRMPGTVKCRPTVAY